MKHTPGPWNASAFGGPHNQGLVIAESTGANVAVIYDIKDAELVAASPDLLEACKLARDLVANAVRFKNDRQPDTRLDTISNLYYVLSSAISKAEGQP